MDDIIVYNRESELEDILNTLPLDIRIICTEYRNKDFTGKDICKKRFITIYHNSREHKFSSSELRSRKLDELE